jgi:hypothetical protein
MCNYLSQTDLQALYLRAADQYESLDTFNRQANKAKKRKREEELRKTLSKEREETAVAIYQRLMQSPEVQNLSAELHTTRQMITQTRAPLNLTPTPNIMLPLMLTAPPSLLPTTNNEITYHLTTQPTSHESDNLFLPGVTQTGTSLCVVLCVHLL